VEFVHDVRVATRRLGEVARVAAGARGVLDKASSKAVQGSLKALRQSMGRLRDADVVTEHLLKWRMPAALKAVARGLAQEHAGERAELAKAAALQLESASFTGTMVILARVLEQPPEASEKIESEMQVALKDLIRKRRKQMKKAFGRAALKQTAESLHQARIAVKKLRYLVELSQAFARGAGREVKVLKQFQELLGDHHDAHVMEEQLQGRLAKGDRKLAAAWRKWHREVEKLQARRAGEFFVRTYEWMNG
jgi:CHAD domain-containing protein